MYEAYSLVLHHENPHHLFCQKYILDKLTRKIALKKINVVNLKWDISWILWTDIFFFFFSFTFFFFKVARSLSLHNHPECSGMTGGRAIETLAQQGNILRYKFTIPMQRYRDCTFSFAGLRSEITRKISKEEKAEGICPKSHKLYGCVLLHVCFEKKKILSDGNSCRSSGRTTSLLHSGSCCGIPLYNDCSHCWANPSGYSLLQRERNHTPRKGNFGKFYVKVIPFIISDSKTEIMFDRGNSELAKGTDSK